MFVRRAPGWWRRALERSLIVTHRERLIQTFLGGQADRMPISPFIYYNSIYDMFTYRKGKGNYDRPLLRG